MFNFALVDIDNICINATSSPNKGVMPVVKEGQILVPITDEQIEIGVMGKFFNQGAGSFEPFENYKLVLVTPGPYTIGTINLVFEQKDINEVPVTVSTTFNVDINGVAQEVLVEDGTLEIALDCPEPATATITITGYRHLPLTQEVVIGG